MRTRLASIAAAALIVVSGAVVTAPAATAARSAGTGDCSLQVFTAAADGLCRTSLPGSHFSILIGCTDGRNLSSPVTLQGNFTQVTCRSGSVRSVSVNCW